MSSLIGLIVVGTKNRINYDHYVFDYYAISYVQIVVIVWLIPLFQVSFWFKEKQTGEHVGLEFEFGTHGNRTSQRPTKIAECIESDGEPKQL